MVGVFWKKNMTNKIKKFLYTLEHLIPDGHDEIPTFALYHPLLPLDLQILLKIVNTLIEGVSLLKICSKF